MTHIDGRSVERAFARPAARRDQFSGIRPTRLGVLTFEYLTRPMLVSDGSKPDCRLGFQPDAIASREG
jgi:hypothetical protein